MSGLLMLNSPSPWLGRGRAGTPAISDIFSTGPDGRTLTRIGEVYGRNDIEKAWNTTLVVAAPDLYKALYNLTIQTRICWESPVIESIESESLIKQLRLQGELFSDAVRAIDLARGFHK